MDFEKYPFTAELSLTYREVKGRQFWPPVRRATPLNPYVLNIETPQPLDTFWIDQTPTMPTVSCGATVKGAFGDITWFPFINWFWRIKTIWHPVNTSYRYLDSLYTYPSPLIGPTYEFKDLAFNGDSIWLKVKIEVKTSFFKTVKDSVDEHRGFIRGRNPARATMNTYFGDDTLRAIGWHESGWKQFLIGNEHYPEYTVQRGCPHQGRADQSDIGIMQINMFWHHDEFPEAGWNWKANIDAGREYFETCLRAAESWNNQHPDLIYENADPYRPGKTDKDDHVLRDAFNRYNKGTGTNLYIIVEENGVKKARPNPHANWAYACIVIYYYYTKPW